MKSNYDKGKKKQDLFPHWTLWILLIISAEAALYWTENILSLWSGRKGVTNLKSYCTNIFILHYSVQTQLYHPSWFYIFTRSDRVLCKFAASGALSSGLLSPGKMHKIMNVFWGQSPLRILETTKGKRSSCATAITKHFSECVTTAFQMC